MKTRTVVFLALFLSTLGLGADPQPASVAKNLFEVFGLNQNASKDETAKAYRKFSIQWHPDADPQNLNPGRFKAAATAYEILNDDASVSAYRDYLKLVESKGEKKISALRQMELFFMAKSFSSGGRISGQDFLQAHRNFLQRNQNYSFNADAKEAERQSETASEARAREANERAVMEKAREAERRTKWEEEQKATKERNRRKQAEEERKFEQAAKERTKQERARVEEEALQAKEKRSRRISTYCTNAFGSLAVSSMAVFTGAYIYQSESAKYKKLQSFDESLAKEEMVLPVAEKIEMPELKLEPDKKKPSVSSPK